ncbi:hypothetical protein AB0B25_05325 [Nocardia sp. NPDC049190]
MEPLSLLARQALHEIVSASAPNPEPPLDGGLPVEESLGIWIEFFVTSM